MSSPTFLFSSIPISPRKPTQTHLSFPITSPYREAATQRNHTLKPIIINAIFQNKKAIAALLGAGFALTLVGSATAAQLPLLGSSLQLDEPANALSLPTWAIHVSSVVEWITAMALVWQYGEKSGYESWKGLSWGMVPLLGGAFCACTWHFFYNSEALEIWGFQPWI
ncbi:uncharacterized protein LOC132307823 isoform X2 [Cornus florida]|uniref:uncharacterized protein LOC132307823 isoform X2 n=1 Tax=Cornus florida TaxID=4283 RepID=UPI00289E08C0|nr:uncharacterized protein LOC132307823 isoform X2 [Cornus florida]